MKTAIYMEGDRLQLVFTPETEMDKIVMKRLKDADLREATIHEGGFYPCQGGWTRGGVTTRSSDSVMIVLDNKEPPQ
jgi:hypothetical protein